MIESKLTVNLEKIARLVNTGLPPVFLLFLFLGHFVSFYLHFLTVAFFFLLLINFFFRHIQKKSTLLANFGVVAQGRYLIESIGPELRQYLYAADTEEKPFSRVERSEIYRKAKNIDSSSAFGSLLSFDAHEFKLKHSMYAVDKAEIEPFSLTFGEERGIDNTFTITKPIIISAMSYGALSDRAVRALARGAAKVGIAMNTGEGGYPKHHLEEQASLIFQMGTAKFGVRDHDGRLDEKKLEALAQNDQIKMIEVKFSQGAKPGKGGLLPKEKVSKEISELRGVPMGEDVISPSRHLECNDAQSTVRFIKKVQDISGLPVGIKMCFGREDEFRELVQAMKSESAFPDYISIDGAEGGTGASPKSFMDDFGVPLFKALPLVHSILQEEGVRDRLKLLCAGKLVNPGRQILAMSMGADACYTARGFMLAIGCIQALQCNRNTCPVGITTHNPVLKSGLDIETKSERVKNYVLNLEHEHFEMLSALGVSSFKQLDKSNVLAPVH